MSEGYILSGEVLAWLSVWSKVQIICIWSSWCHCHPIISCSSKILNGFPSGAGLPRLSWKKMTEHKLGTDMQFTCY